MLFSCGVNKMLMKNVSEGEYKMNGTVHFWHNKRGYGFIKGENGESYFVGFPDVISRHDFKSLDLNEEVTFEPLKQSRETYKYDRALKVLPIYADEKPEEAKYENTSK